MAELKTKKTTQNPVAFLESVEGEQKKKDSFELLEMMKTITGEEPAMWGTSIIGYGMYHYKSERSRQEGDWPLIGFSPRKQNLTLYVMTGFEGKEELLAKLGKHKASVGCLYINRLADVDVKVLKQIIEKAFIHMKKLHSK